MRQPFHLRHLRRTRGISSFHETFQIPKTGIGVVSGSCLKSLFLKTDGLKAIPFTIRDFMEMCGSLQVRQDLQVRESIAW